LGENLQQQSEAHAHIHVHATARDTTSHPRYPQKLDMAKAYDRVEWCYLRAIMTKMGFASEWIEKVMECVETVSFSVRVNGNLSEVFKPTRGIRQGDPISPYLFLICAEGFSCMLKYYGAGHLSRGVRVGIHCPWISHFLFADDCLVFTQATAEGANRLKEILERYRRVLDKWLINRNWQFSLVQIRLMI
jgi:hypothetical protein